MNLSSEIFNKINLKEEEGFLFVEKPPGIPTHAPGDDDLGFAELLSEKIGRKLYVVHRLDKETSGVMVFAHSSESAAALGKIFEERSAKKTYCFVTTRAIPAEREFIHRSYIKKYRGRFVSWPRHTEMNSETHFSFEREKEGRSLWRAEPHTGKPHQIRLHAKDLGLHILGDSSHGGPKFSRLMLHARQLAFTYRGVEYRREAALPEEFI